MKLEDFSFSLPKDHIAKWPLLDRTQSKLLVIDRKTGKFYEDIFRNFKEYISDEYFIVMNNTKVNKARLFGKKKSGGRIELLLAYKINDYEYLGLIKGKVKNNETLYISDKEYITAKIFFNSDSVKLKRIVFNGISGEEIMERFGNVPIPPYLKRKAEKIDENYYQTVYAKVPGSIAAPTAGLHFDEKLINDLKEAGIEILEITLNVSFDTFNPITETDILKHKMHSETYYIDSNVKDKINTLKKNGKKLLAIGTTVVRALEDASDINGLIVKDGLVDTNLYITPGYKFKTVDALVTNFHLPKSSLFILVSTFYELEKLKNLYNYAISKNYRFYSYGDGMLIL
jgi:S-adenosylmethionine:tRNA ribosyltransferase-isomerase